jgi:hypothetical protein
MIILSNLYSQFAKRTCWLLYGIAFLCFATTPIQAQTRFEWPSTTKLDLTKYRKADECLARIDRLRDSANRTDSIWHDTLETTAADILDPHPSFVVEAARRCSEKFSVKDSIHPEDFISTLQLFLIANRDDDVSYLIERRLASISSSDISARAALLDTLIRIYVNARPARFNAIEPFLEELSRPETEYHWRKKKELFDGVFLEMRLANDTIHAQEMANRIVRFGESISEDIKRTELDLGAMFFFMGAKLYLQHNALLDSLKKGTAGYIAQYQANLAALTGESSLAVNSPIGQRAPVIEGDYWFPQDAAKIPPPVTGEVTLVYFLTEGCATDCFEQYAILRRFAARYPDLRIVLVARTLGHLGRLAPPSPEEEADLLRQSLLERQRISATLVVSKTPIWRLSDPDRRPVAEEIPALTKWTFGRTANLGAGSAVLVDENGIIVYTADLHRKTEADFNKMVHILMNRQRSNQ